MVQVPQEHLRLVVSGEAGQYVEALARIVGPRWLETYRVRSDGEMIELVQTRQADAVVLDDQATTLEALQVLRMIRRINEHLLVVLLTGRNDRRLLQEAMRLAAFSVVAKPLRLEELLFQIHRMMVRLDEDLHRTEP